MSAFAFKICEMWADVEVAEATTKICFDCDPDNPRAVAPGLCPTCKGSQKQGLGLKAVMEELRSVPLQEKGSSFDDGEDETPAEEIDSDLLLEY